MAVALGVPSRLLATARLISGATVQTFIVAVQNTRMATGKKAMAIISSNIIIISFPPLCCAGGA
jgi:hypothetical protein